MELQVQNLHIAFGDVPIIQDVSFTIHSGESIGIIGPNGSGKSTLLKGIRGLVPRQEGSITLDGVDLDHMSEGDVAKRIAYMQQSTAVNFAFTAKDIVMTGRYPYLQWWEQEGPEDEALVEAVMKSINIWHLRHRPINELSGGERQRVFLGKALAQNTEVLLLDEPTSALDMVYADDMFRYSTRAAEEGKCIVTVVHDLELAAKFCTRLLLVSQGRIVADGTPRDVLRADHLRTAFGLASAVYDDPYFQQRRIYVFPKDATDIEPYRRGSTLPDDISIALHDHCES